MNDKIWSVTQEIVYKDVDELRERIVAAWNERFDQRVINNAISQWRTRLRAMRAR